MRGPQGDIEPTERELERGACEGGRLVQGSRLVGVGVGGGVRVWVRVWARVRARARARTRARARAEG